MHSIVSEVNCAQLGDVCRTILNFGATPKHEGQEIYAREFYRLIIVEYAVIIN